MVCPVLCRASDRVSSVVSCPVLQGVWCGVLSVMFVRCCAVHPIFVQEARFKRRAPRGELRDPSRRLSGMGEASEQSGVGEVSEQSGVEEVIGRLLGVGEVSEQ